MRSCRRNAGGTNGWSALMKHLGSTNMTGTWTIDEDVRPIEKEWNSG